MTLRPVYGNEELQRRLAAAFASQRLPQSLLFVGPTGAGKQRLALWLGSLVLCETPDAGQPCGRCRSCRLADDLQHPDLHWFFPLPSPKGSSTPVKRREMLESARHEALAARRESPIQPTGADRAAALFLPIVDEIRSRATRRPAMARGAVFVIGDADRMVPQASSPEAANAFLKLLEEPPEDTVFILTSSRPGLLLDTVRSRVTSLRVPAAGTAETADFLVREAGVERDRAEALARRSGGIIGAALRLAEEPDDPRAEAVRFVRAALSDRPARRWEVAAALGPSGARGAFSDLLDSVEAVLRDCITLSTGARAAAVEPDLAGQLESIAPIEPERWISAASRVERARTAALGNGNPQAIAAVLLADMARELRPRRIGGPERPGARRVRGAS